MERVRNRKAHVALLLGHLELSVAPTQSRQVPNSGACNGHKGTAPDCGDCQAATGGGEWAAHDYCGCGADLAFYLARPTGLPCFQQEFWLESGQNALCDYPFA